MKRRILTSLALALALGGCTTYGYVDDGGGYYTGGASTRYIYPAYGGYGYGYGAPYYGYAPGWSFGLGYGYGYGHSHGYGSPYYPRHPGYRPPYYPRPPYPGHHDGSGHGGRPGHRPPPVADGDPPPLDRAPWRDLERMRRGEADGSGPRRRPGPDAMQAGAMSGEAPDVRQDMRRGQAMRSPPPAYRSPAPRIADADDGMARPPMRSGRSMPRDGSRSRGTDDSTPSRIGTPDTVEP